MNAPRSARQLERMDVALKVVRAARPHDCPDTCGMLVTVKDGVAVKIRGDPGASPTSAAAPPSTTALSR